MKKQLISWEVVYKAAGHWRQTLGYIQAATYSDAMEIARQTYPQYRFDLYLFAEKHNKKMTMCDHCGKKERLQGDSLCKDCRKLYCAIWED